MFNLARRDVDDDNDGVDGNDADDDDDVDGEGLEFKGGVDCGRELLLLLGRFPSWVLL